MKENRDLWFEKTSPDPIDRYCKSVVLMWAYYLVFTLFLLGLVYLISR